MTGTTFPILHTKIHRPKVTNDLVARLRLVELLERGLHGQMTLVCAPAGFGKTTLVSSFLEALTAGKERGSTDLPAAWLSLDTNDSDEFVFLRYLISALRTIFPGACAKTFRLLQALQQPPPEILSASLSNELEGLPGEFILVLDDYQKIQGVEVPILLEEILLHWPRTLHLVLISRSNPPLSLARLRANGQLIEIRTRDLRFNKDETVEFLSRTSQVLTNAATVEKLSEIVEGWIGALRLVTLSMRTTGDIDNLIRIIGESQEALAQYLAEEVLNHQLPAVQTFLLKTSILDRFCAPLCEAVIGEVDPAWSARASIDWLERSELLMVSLDDHKEWYRYHNLFQDFLQRRSSAVLAPEQVNNLHCQASAWFEGQGLIEDALKHALLANDLDLAVGLMERGLCDVLNRADLWILRHWLRLLPEELVLQRPWLLMIKSWVLHFSFQLNALSKNLDQVESLIDGNVADSPDTGDLLLLRGQIAGLRAQEAYFNNQIALAGDYCREALALLPKSWKYAISGAMLYSGLCMQASGEEKAAGKAFLELYESLEDKSDIFALRLLQALCFNYMNENLLENCRQIAELLLHQAIQSKMGFMQYWAHFILGTIYYQWNELDLADDHFANVIENHYLAHLAPLQHSIFGMTLIRQARGENAEAIQTIERAKQLDIERIGYEDEKTRSMHARIMLLQSDFENAFRWADAFSLPLTDHALFFLEEPYLTKARVLITRNKSTDLLTALRNLDVLYQIAERTHNHRYKTEIQAVRALALDAQGNKGGAYAALKQALAYAQPSGSIRVFVDQGGHMQELLAEIAGQGYQTEFIQHILSAFPSLPHTFEPRVEQFAMRNSESGFIEPLSRRELEILRMLREPYSMKQIAGKLNISPLTVKRHAINIYSKLGVNTRWDAVAMALDLGLLATR